MKYSVIIPIYNAESTLVRCIESLVAQKREDMELLLINDGSTDKSGDICRRFQQKFSYIRYFSQDNKGVSAARNFGLDHARGTYVIFVDSDDFVAHNYLTIADAALEQHDTELVILGQQYISGELVSTIGARKVTTESSAVHQIIIQLFRRQQLNALPAKVFCRRVIECSHLRFHDDLSVGEDSLFVFRYVLHICAIRTIDTPVYYVDVSNGQSLTRRYRPYLCDQFLKIHTRMISAVGACNWSEDDRRGIQEAVIWSYYRSAYSVCKDLRKSEMTPKQRRQEICNVCRRYMKANMKSHDWKCRLIAIPIQMRMALLIDWMTAMR